MGKSNEIYYIIPKYPFSKRYFIFVCCLLLGSPIWNVSPKWENGVTLGGVPSYPCQWQTSKCLIDYSAWCGKPTSVLNFFSPPFQCLTNMTHLGESDKTIYVRRLSTKLEALYRTEAFQGKSRALACQVNELLVFFSAEPTDLFRDITHYIMVIV